ncbi:MAG: chloride channel protein [Gemmataceae bacterium]
MSDVPQEPEEERPSWSRLFSPHDWWCHAVWFVAASLAGAGALAFYYADLYAAEFVHWALESSPLLPALFVTIGIVVVCRLRDLVFPGTEGTGIPQTIAALKIPEGPGRSAVLSLWIAAGKILLLTIGLFSGATIGREGPSVHVGACFMYLSSKLARFPGHLVERGMILAGGAAGIAAAFNAPISGTIFALEEIGRSFEKNNAGTIIRTVAVACIVCIIFLGIYHFYGHEVENAALVGSTWEHTVRAWLAVPVLGVVFGLLGGLFAQAVASTSPRIVRLSRQNPYLTAISLGLAMAAIGLLSDGLSYLSGYSEAKVILTSEHNNIPWHYPFFKAAASFVSLISGIPGGLFDPSLSVGAGLGQLVRPLFPYTPAQALVLLAMVSYFSGVVQSPITAFVILGEMTGAWQMALPMMVASILAYEISRLVCPVSLYESLAHSFLRAQEQHQQQKLQAAENA